MEASTTTTVLITGASQGLGLAFAEAFALRRYRVIATHRRQSVPRSLAALSRACPNVFVYKMDVTDHADIAALASHLREPIDVLLNNAALIRRAPLEDTSGNAGQVLGSLAFDDFDEFMRTNIAGPLKIMEAFMPHLRLGKQKKIVAVSSEAGSVSVQPNGADHYWYRISKAGLNMAMRLAAQQLRAEGITVVLLNPGGVQVPSLGLAQLRGCVSPGIAVPEMVALIEELSIHRTDTFIKRNGSIQPW